jgi:hypothetical protein
MQARDQKNMNDIITRYLGELHTVIKTESVRISRTASPFSGNGQLTQLPAMLIQETRNSLENLLEKLSGIDIGIFTLRDIIGIKEDIISKYRAQISYAIELSSFQVIKKQDENYLKMQVDHLQHEISMIINSKFGQMELNRKAKRLDKILGLLKIILNKLPFK